VKEEAAAKLTRYFGSGVVASIWCYARDGNWKIEVKREERATFYDLDSLQRAVWRLSRKVGNVWVLNDMRAETPITLHTFDDALACAQELKAAVHHIQSVSTEECWQEVPMDVFELRDSERNVSCPK
jgi:hypothetical protein